MVPLAVTQVLVEQSSFALHPAKGQQVEDRIMERVSLKSEWSVGKLLLARERFCLVVL